MVDTNRPRLKVSRAGIVLIKSFESFRPRAVRREDGRWVIGYGHTASAREGLTVGEPDAELLLQYDLIPVARALNEQVEAPLNQHQFDALASFAVSVGVDRFMGSDVLKRVNAGQTGEAADALINQTGTVAPDSSLRRRAAERALFVADPAAPVLLSDLLAAPLPPPPVVVAPEPGPVEPAPVVEPVAETANDPAPLSRAAAVVSLLGEPHAPETGPEAPVEVPAPAPEPEVPPEPEAPNAPPVAPLPSPSVWAPQKRADVSEAPNAAFFQRYSPYSTMVVGPLPGFAALEPEIEAEAEPVAEPEPVVEAEAAVTPVVAETPVEVAPPEPEPEPEPAPEPVVEPVVEAVETRAATPVEPPVVAPHPVAPSRVEAPVELPVFGQAPTASPFPPLELTPAVEADFVEVERPVWGAEQREPATGTEETVLFEDEPPLAVLRHEVEPAAPRRFDWIETGPYMIMGGLGLFSCAASAAAFRKAMSDRSPLDDFSVIAWVLALIGVICVGVSAWNLYRKAGKRDGDEG